MSASELVVLPYREMHNSGSVLAALSLGRPVLVPANAANERLAEEMGAGWVRTYRDDLTSADLVAVLGSLREQPLAGSPDLSAREWSDAGEQHRAAFEQALDAAPGPLARTAAQRLYSRYFTPEAPISMPTPRDSVRAPLARCRRGPDHGAEREPRPAPEQPGGALGAQGEVGAGAGRPPSARP